MPSQSILKVRGLYNSDNPYSEVPEGALTEATNVVIQNRGVIEPRRGQEDYAYNFASASERAAEVAFYGTAAIVHTSENHLTRDTGAAWSSYGSFTAPDATALRMKFAEAAQNLYFTTNLGVKVLDAVSGTPTAVGLPRPYESYTESRLYGEPNEAGSWLPANSSVAYRLLLGRKDANNRVRWSEPSPRLIITNPPDATVSLTRVANVVTATVTSGTHSFGTGAGARISISPGGGTFGTGPFTVSSTPSSTSFTYSEVAADAGPLAAQTASSGAKQVLVYVRLRNGLVGAAGDYIRIYRSEASALASIPPDDELFLVHEGVITAADMSSSSYVPVNSVVTSGVLDATPEELLGAVPLYTNPSTGDGIGQSNTAPPLGKDVVAWGERLWLANTTDKQRLALRALGVGSPDGIQTNDTITIAGRTYRAVTALAASGDFLITSNLSASVNTERTTKYLVRASILDHFGSLTTIRGAYTSGETDGPGETSFEDDVLGTNPFYVSASRPVSWNPAPPLTYTVAIGALTRAASTVTATTGAAHDFVVGQSVYLSSNSVDPNYAAGLKTVVATPTATTFTYTEAGTTVASLTAYVVSATTLASSNDRAPNRLFYSKLQESSAFPLVNYLDVGSESHAILRVLALRDKLMVVKEDGFYTVSGQYPFRVDPLDTTVKPVSADSFVVLNNLVYGLTDQGVVTVSDGGVTIISRPIEASLRPLLTDTVAGFKAACFGVAYEADRSYLLWTPSTAAGTANTQAFVYNYFTSAWTTRTDARTAGRVSPGNRLYLGTSSLASLTKERKNFLPTDHLDAALPFTITVDEGSSIYTIASNPGIAIGSYITQGAATGIVTGVALSVIVQVAVLSGTFAPGAAVGYAPTQYTVRWTPYTAGVLPVKKQFPASWLHFARASFYSGSLTFRTPESYTTETDELPSVRASTGPYDFREIVALEKQLAQSLEVGFSLNEAAAYFKLCGYTAEVEPFSEWGQK